MRQGVTGTLVPVCEEEVSEAGLWVHAYGHSGVGAFARASGEGREGGLGKRRSFVQGFGRVGATARGTGLLAGDGARLPGCGKWACLGCGKLVGLVVSLLVAYR